MLKSQANSTTQGSKVEQILQAVVDNGNMLIKGLDTIESDFATKAEVTHARQVECKQILKKIYALVKNGNKLKLIEGCIIGVMCARFLP